jgi:hypothetical protein
MTLFAVNIFLSAFLLFQIQPMIGRFILPRFGGSPAVWSTLMLAFQVLLTGGYAYAAWLIGRVRRQALVHIPLLIGAILVLIMHGFSGSSPLMPSMSAVSHERSSPVLEIIGLLLLSVAVPYFALAANSPLMQAWFTRIHADRSYARLYALSNLGSLLGLLTYPILIEPNFSLRSQGWIWSAGFLLFGLLTGWIALKSGGTPVPSQPSPGAVSFGDRPSMALRSLWVALSATASLFLLSVTNQITQDVAVIPFLWVLPLSIYLLSFILTFSGERGYHRKAFGILFVVSAVLTLYVMLNTTRLHVYWQILVYCLLLFAACMLCHGELYRLRPSADHLTGFYLMVSVGGALGGIFVSLIAPIIFNGYWEFLVGLAMALAVLLSIFRPSSILGKKQLTEEREDLSARARFILIIFLLVSLLLSVMGTYFSGSLFSKRNFYGVVRVREMVPDGSGQPAYVLSHGITVHGLQFIGSAQLRARPTTYYVPESGVGLAILHHPKYEQGRPMRVGLLGLGVGTLLTYARPGDVYRLYEINPVVNELASGKDGYFTFLSESKADLTLVSGDARISLQNELESGNSQNFDVLVLDTFSSDSIPVHLVTKEAFGLYLQHLAPDGIIAVHITNLHLDLQPVLWQVAKYYGLSIARVNYDGDTQGGYASQWILLARDPVELKSPAIQERAVDLGGYSTDIKLWTDDYSNLFQILK